MTGWIARVILCMSVAIACDAAAIGKWPIGSDAISPQTAPAQPTLVEVIGSDNADCGLFPIGGEAKRIVILRNRSEHPVRLRVVSSSCACVNHSFDAEEVPPGKEGKLKLSVVVTGGFGLQQHHIVVSARSVGPVSSKDGVQTIPIGIAFTPDRSYEVNPQQVVATVVAGEEAEWRVHIARKSPGDLLVEDLECTLEGVRVIGPTTVIDNSTVQMIAMQSRWPEPGMHTGWLMFQTNSSKLPKGHVEISLRVLPAWRAEPVAIVAAAQQAREFEIVLRRRIDNCATPSTVHLSENDQGAWSCSAAPVADGADWKLRVRFDPGRVPPAIVAGRSMLIVRGADDARLLDIPLVWHRLAD